MLLADCCFGHVPEFRVERAAVAVAATLEPADRRRLQPGSHPSLPVGADDFVGMPAVTPPRICYGVPLS